MRFLEWEVKEAVTWVCAWGREWLNLPLLGPGLSNDEPGEWSSALPSAL